MLIYAILGVVTLNNLAMSHTTTEYLSPVDFKFENVVEAHVVSLRCNTARER